MVFIETLFSFEGFDPSVPHVPHVRGKILVELPNFVFLLRNRESGYLFRIIR